MDLEITERASRELFDLFNYMRITFEGILAGNNPNVWNIFGGLNRAKKATYNILTHELRTNSYDRYEKDCKQILCEKLFTYFPFDENVNDIHQFEDGLSDWIEQHLLDHSLYRCLKCAFLQTSCENYGIFPLYKEFSFVKNEMLLNSFLSCLDSLQQNIMDQLASVNPVLVIKSRFLVEISPWVSEKIAEEYKIDFYPLDSSSLVELSNQDNRCNSCGQILTTTGNDLSCGCYEVSTLTDEGKSTNVRPLVKTVASSQYPLSQDILIKSALEAVMEHTQENCDWFEETDNLDSVKPDHIEDLRMRFARMKEISRSESSLFQEPGHITSEMKLAHSENDIIDTDHLITDSPSVQEFSNEDDTSSFIDMPLPKSSSTISKKRGHTRSKSDQIGSTTFGIDSVDSGRTATALMASSLPKEVTHTGMSCYYQNEDGQMFPKPYKGQSLISYLESRSYDTGAQLDKENAHFSICEALITAIEQMRCQNSSSEESGDNSDEEIRNLREEIKNRKHLKKMTKKSNILAFSDPSDTGRSSSSFKTSSTFSSSIGSSSCMTDETGASISPGPDGARTISASWENVSLASSNTLLADARKRDDSTDNVEIIQADEIPPDDFSAEAVAKSLLKKFEGRPIPAASELKWMITEEEVPQQLLPLPTAWPIAPDTHLQEKNELGVAEGLQKVSMPSLLRGNWEWAPPRPQIIFNPHAFVKRKVLLQRQHFRCAGCGLKVTPNLSKRFRYCEYVGKYFCTSCHQNKLTSIPAKILSKWDFKKYPVSDFAKELLKKINRDPLFNVLDVSPKLYQNERQLAITRSLRLQLHYLKNFIRTCRFANSNQKEMSKLSMHITDDPHAYSIDDLVQVKTGEMVVNLKYIVNNAIKHVKADCPICSAKGFVCEFCRDGNNILYPFDLQKVHICDDCKSCSHRSCYVPGKCPRCARIKARQEMLKEKLPSSPES